MTSRPPAHDEHAALRPGLEATRAAADLLGHTPVPDLRAAVAGVRAFLVDELAPHAAAEEEVLYPAICDVLHSSDATVGMLHDHEQLRRLAAELDDIDRELADTEVMTLPLAGRMRRVLYGLYALLLTHFAKEEELYLPRLAAALDAGGLAALQERLATAARRHRAERG